MAESTKRMKSTRVTSSKTLQCIVHVPGLKYGTLNKLYDTKYAGKKLQKLQEVKKLRLQQPPHSRYRMSDACAGIPDKIAEHHAFHWVCYKRFTMNLNRLKPRAETSTENNVHGRNKRKISGDQILFNPDCIFCGSDQRKKMKIRGSWTTQGICKFESDGWKSVMDQAEKKQDEKLLTRIRGHDLFACEAKFHRQCRIQYMQDPEKWRSKDCDAKQKQNSLEDAHSQAFLDVCNIIETEVLQDKHILQLSDLTQTYVDSLKKSNYSNPDYRNEKLKSKLERHKLFQGKLSFCEVGKFKSCLLYSADVGIQMAIKQAFQLGLQDKVQSVGVEMKEIIADNFSHSNDLRWPPMPTDLEDLQQCIPKELEELLCFIITGKKSAASVQFQRLIQSIGQDICRASTGGKWKLPKHITLSVTLHHLFRSERLITLINRLGHCESYSFTLELQTAIASALIESSSQLSNKITKWPKGPTLCHSEFDNFDCLLNDLTGKGSVHTAHGSMLQEVTEDQNEAPFSEKSFQARNRQRSLKLEVQPLPDCYLTQRQSPKMEVKKLEYENVGVVLERSTRKHMLWIMMRILLENNQSIPVWSGFVSETGSAPTKLTTIDYYPVINYPITEYRTVQECLRVAEETTTEVGQQYVITTFDLGVCMKAFPLVWNSPEKYKNHIIMIGTFHLICAYMKAVGKKMSGSGLEEVFLESGLVGNGSIDGVMGGKHYDRAINCHTVILENLESLLLNQFVKYKGAKSLFDLLPEGARTALTNLSENLDSETLSIALGDATMTSVLQQYSVQRGSIQRPFRKNRTILVIIHGTCSHYFKSYRSCENKQLCKCMLPLLPK